MDSIATLSLRSLLAAAFAATVATSCAGNAPKMERPIAIWNGAPEKEAICRLAKDPSAALIKSQAAYKITQDYASTIVRYALKDGRTMECIPAEAQEFKRYGCMLFDDIGVLQRYIERLNFSCEKWKPTNPAQNGMNVQATPPRDLPKADKPETLTDEKLNQLLK